LITHAEELFLSKEDTTAIFNEVISEGTHATHVEPVSETLAQGEAKLECEEHIEVWGSSVWYFDLFVAILCCCSSGMMSGLTVGMTSLDHLALEIQAKENPEF
jgi:metal transporter CNNM